MNAEEKGQERVKKLMAASQLTREESVKVNAEFAAIEHDPET